MQAEERIKELIIDKYGNVRAFATESGISYTTVRSILERGIMNAKADSKFKWTKAYFDSIVDGTTTYDEIVATVGEPNKTETDTDYDFDTDSKVPTKDCDWDLDDGSYDASVSIHFVQKNGTYVVDNKIGSGLK
ncbi:immunity protein [Streptococcus phage CHPC879]|uniref:Immunity protein n=1 Tax=Streptococcus phage CHPC879 TaxID=2365045 RepID=A0A3G8FC46_9CAUD|nr:immunity protein [Streptococcus phage CHPC879]AZF92358.1 immunity protein [Streptococcus phage CHPC879]